LLRTPALIMHDAAYLARGHIALDWVLAVRSPWTGDTPPASRFAQRPPRARSSPMSTASMALVEAWRLVAQGDAKLFEIVGLSLRVSAASIVVATLFAMPLGALLAVTQFRGQRTVIVTLNALLGLPSVVVGLVVYLLLSRAGPLGALGILFTPVAMVIAQAVLVTPLIAALTRQAISDAWQETREQLQSLGAGPWACALALLWGDDRRRQHRRRHAGDDDRDRAGDVQRRPAAGARPGPGAAGHRTGTQCDRASDA
jgi:ABC-type glycerol-3-phosphate transport system permease component